MNNDISRTIEAILAADPRPVPEEFADRDLMMGKAYEQAVKALVGAKDGEVLPTWAILTENGQVVIVATPFTDGEESKEMVADLMRKFMRQIKAIRYTFLSEAWAAAVTAEEWEAGDRRPPSERDTRIEIVLVACSDRDGASLKTYEIQRDETGVVTALKPIRPEEPMNNLEGRFANLLEDDQ